MSEVENPKIIKRYANRKLYDTERSCYVTLEDIAEMIRASDNVKVIDNRSGNDLTCVTLAQIIFETEKKRHSMPLGLLRSLIQDGGGTIGDLAKERIDYVQSRATELRTNAQETARELRDNATIKASEIGQVAYKLRENIEGRVGRVGRVIGVRPEGGIDGGSNGAEEPLVVKEEVLDFICLSESKLKDLQARLTDTLSVDVNSDGTEEHSWMVSLKGLQIQLDAFREQVRH